LIRVELVGVRVEQATNQPIVLLREPNSAGRHLPIFIGQPEATSIVYALQGIETPRPMTHDLVTNTWREMGIRLHQVNVTDLKDGTFYAELELVQHGEVYRDSSRPSDAIALSVRAHVPILVHPSVMDEAGIIPEQDMPEGNEPPEKSEPAPLSQEGVERLSVFEDFLGKLDLDKLDDKDKPEDEEPPDKPKKPKKK